MYKIYIDTTDRFNKSIRIEKTSDQNHQGVEVYKKEGDIDVVSEMESWMQVNKINIEQIEEIIPKVGPGSFTGIKSGITIANVANQIILNKKIQYEPNYGKEPNIQKN